jgi:integrase
VALEARGLGSISINVRITAVPKLAVEAADNGLLARITRIKGVRSKGVRLEKLAFDPAGAGPVEHAGYDIEKRPPRPRYSRRSFGCGLRRSEVAALTSGHIHQRDGRWCIVDLIGKHGRVRRVPMATWTKVAIDGWTSAAGLIGAFSIPVGEPA